MLEYFNFFFSGEFQKPECCVNELQVKLVRSSPVAEKALQRDEQQEGLDNPEQIQQPVILKWLPQSKER